jgi:antitoxin HicB
MTKTGVAKAMGTSRAAVDRLLDPDNTSVTLNTLDRAARVLVHRHWCVTLRDNTPYC